MNNQTKKKKKISLFLTQILFNFLSNYFFNNPNNYFCRNYQIREKYLKISSTFLSNYFLSIQSKPKNLFILIPLSLVQILFNFTASHTNSFFFFFFSIILIPLLPSSTTMMPISLCQGQDVEDLVTTHGSHSDVGQNYGNRLFIFKFGCNFHYFKRYDFIS